jgi:hypothetical protein
VVLNKRRKKIASVIFGPVSYFFGPATAHFLRTSSQASYQGGISRETFPLFGFVIYRRKKLDSVNGEVASPRLTGLKKWPRSLGKKPENHLGLPHL